MRIQSNRPCPLCAHSFREIYRGVIERQSTKVGVYDYKGYHVLRRKGTQNKTPTARLAQIRSRLQYGAEEYKKQIPGNFGKQSRLAFPASVREFRRNLRLTILNTHISDPSSFAPIIAQGDLRFYQSGRDYLTLSLIATSRVLAPAQT